MATMRLRALAILLALAGCKALEPVPPPPLEVLIRVNGDPGQPIKDADVLYNGQKVAKSAEDGVAKLTLKGKDGEIYDVNVTCPEGFQSPSKPVQIIVKRLADPTKRPEYDVACPPTTRTVVVAVRADGGANLPVMYLGREVGRTDSAGAAHVMLRLKSEDSFDLMLSTADNDRLRPQNPAASFLVKDRDEVFTFDQKFGEEKKKPKPGGRRGPVKIGK